MKNLFVFASVLLVISIVMVSCSKDEAIVKELESSVEVSNKDYVINSVRNFDNNYASFESEEAMAKFVRAYIKLSDAEKETILKDLNYETLNAHISKLYDGMAIIETERDFEVYINYHSENFKIILNSDGEKEVAEKERTNFIIAPFLNKNRIIKVGNVFKKYMKFYVIQSGNIIDLEAIKSSSDVETSGLDFIVTPRNQRQELYSTKTYTYTKDKRWCKNDRRLTLEAFYSQTNALSGTGYDFLPQVLITARRKGIPCIWYKYSTNINWKNFHFKISKDGTAWADWTAPNRSTYGKTLGLSYNELVYSGYTSNAPTVIWTKQRCSAGSQGIGANYLEVDE